MIIYFMLQDEYDALLKYAVVMPSFDPSQFPKTLTDVRGSFPLQNQATSEEPDTGESLSL